MKLPSSLLLPRSILSILARVMKIGRFLLKRYEIPLKTLWKNLQKSQVGSEESAKWSGIISKNLRQFLLNHWCLLGSFQTVNQITELTWKTINNQECWQIGLSALILWSNFKNSKIHCWNCLRRKSKKLHHVN